MTGIANYVLATAFSGLGWLILKNRRRYSKCRAPHGRICLIGVLICHRLVSIWTPLASPPIFARWFSWPNILFGSSSDRDCRYRARQLLARARPVGLKYCVSSRRRTLCPIVCRHRHQSLSDDRAPPFHLVGGGVLGTNASVSPGRNTRAPAGDPDVHRLVLLGISRQSPSGRRLSLRFPRL